MQKADLNNRYADLSATRGEMEYIMKTMELGTIVSTPRFCTVTISAIFEHSEDAIKCGYIEPTHTQLPEWEIKGKSIDMYHMEFAAIKK